jgi:nitrogen PTS system EIIA component
MDFPSPTLLLQIALCGSLCFLDQPVDFGALGARSVQALFTLISPMLYAHLHLLSRLLFALRDAKFKALVMAQVGRDELMKAIRRTSAWLPRLAIAPGEGTQPAGGL